MRGWERPAKYDIKMHDGELHNAFDIEGPCNPHCTYEPVTDLGLILEACKLKGWEADVGTDMEFGYNASVWHGESRHTPTPDVFEYGDTPLDALALAIRRAIEAVE